MRSIRRRLLPSTTLFAVSIWIVSCCLSSQNNHSHHVVSRLLRGGRAPSRYGHPVSDHYQLVFVDIPKTGGRKISKSFLLDDARKTYGPSAPFTIETIYNAMPESTRSLYYKTAVIRHPCSRFVETFQFLHAAYLGKVNISGAVRRLFAERFPGLFENVRDVSDFAMKLTITKQWDKLQYQFFHFFPLTSYTFLSNGDFGLDSIICDDEPEIGLQRLEQHISTLSTTTNDTQPQLQALQDQLSAAPDLCQDLPLTTRQLIATHYALDLCVFGYDSTILGASKCLGDTLQKDDFTARYHSCRAKISQQQEEQQVKEYNYAYVQQIEEEPESEPFIVAIPLQ